MTNEYNDLWELDRGDYVSIITELRAALAEAERERDEARAEADKSWAAFGNLTDIACAHLQHIERQRCTIRALVVAARAMWRCHMEMAYIDSSESDYVQWISEKVCEVENEQAERGQAGKE